MVELSKNAHSANWGVFVLLESWQWAAHIATIQVYTLFFAPANPRNFYPPFIAGICFSQNKKTNERYKLVT